MAFNMTIQLCGLHSTAAGISPDLKKRVFDTSRALHRLPYQMDPQLTYEIDCCCEGATRVLLDSPATRLSFDRLAALLQSLSQPSKFDVIDDIKKSGGWYDLCFLVKALVNHHLLS